MPRQFADCPTQERVLCLITALVLITTTAHADPMCGCEHRYDLLMEFYDAASGPQWNRKSGWGTLGSCTDWAGVICDRDLGDVTGVDMYSNSISGALPASWSSLSNLTSLHLEFNNLSGTLPASWSALWNLRFLYLNSNSIIGTLPASWSSLSNLTSLHLESNNLSGTLPASWSAMWKLGILRLESNNFSGTLPSSWSNMSMLYYLDLHANSIEGPIPPTWGRTMKELRTFAIGANRIVGALPEELLSLSNMSFFSVAFNNLSGPVPRTASASLTVLALQNNAQLTGSLPAMLPANCVVSLCDTNVACPPAPFPMQLCLPRDVEFTEVTPAILAYISACATPAPNAVPDHHTTTTVTFPVEGSLAMSPHRYEKAAEVALTAIWAALIAGANAPSRGAVPALQRALSALRLASYCEIPVVGDAVELRDTPFSSSVDNPLLMTVPVSPSVLEYAAGAAVGNTLLVGAIGLAAHLSGMLQHRWAEHRQPEASSSCTRFAASALSLLPSSMLPGSLAVGYGTLLQPSVGACVALLMAGTEPILCGVGVLCLWVCLPLYCARVLLWRGRARCATGMVFLLKSRPSAGDGHPRRAGRNRRDVRAILWSVWRYATTPSAEWTTRHVALSVRSREFAHFMLSRLDAVFGAYVARREWFFLVEWGVCALSGIVVLGVAETMAWNAEDSVDACSVAQWGMWCALACGAAEISLCLWLRPFCVRLDLWMVVVVELLGMLSQSLALGGETTIAAGVVFGASLLEFVVIVMVMLLGGAERIERHRTRLRAAEKRPTRVAPERKRRGRASPRRTPHALCMLPSAGSPRLTALPSEQLRYLVELACRQLACTSSSTRVGDQL